MPKNTPKTRDEHTETEYKRLVSLYTEAGVDEIKLRVNDSLIHKVAEVFGILESIKHLPTIIYDPKNPAVQRETAAGKTRVKYMAQYVSSMQKLNKEMLGALDGDDGDELDDYE